MSLSCKHILCVGYGWLAVHNQTNLGRECFMLVLLLLYLKSLVHGVLQSPWNTITGARYNGAAALRPSFSPLWTRLQLWRARDGSKFTVNTETRLPASDDSGSSMSGRAR